MPQIGPGRNKVSAEAKGKPSLIALHLDNGKGRLMRLRPVLTLSRSPSVYRPVLDYRIGCVFHHMRAASIRASSALFFKPRTAVHRAPCKQHRGGQDPLKFAVRASDHRAADHVSAVPWKSAALYSARWANPGAGALALTLACGFLRPNRVAQAHASSRKALGVVSILGCGCPGKRFE